MNDPIEPTRGLLACLGDASRYRIVATLTSGARCVTELAHDVALSQSCTTRHLQVLERAGLVRGERQGRRVVFRLRVDDPRVDGLLRWIMREGPALEPVAVDPRGSARPPDPGRRRAVPRPAAATTSGRRPVRAAIVDPGDPRPRAETARPVAGPATVPASDPPPARPRPSADLEDFLL